MLILQAPVLTTKKIHATQSPQLRALRLFIGFRASVVLGLWVLVFGLKLRA